MSNQNATSTVKLKQSSEDPGSSSNKTNPLSGCLQQALVLDLAGVDAGMLQTVGGKAANLGEMIRAKLPVPPGVCVTTEAYRQVAATVAIDFDALSAAALADALVLTVTDTGHGIAAADLPHVFERFYRTQDATDRAIQGSGLGLAVVKSIVASHRGQVEITSTPGSGTAVAVSLPVAATRQER